MKIYIPSYLGDVALQSDGEKSKLIYSELTDFEKVRLIKFLSWYDLEINEEAKQPVELAIPDPIRIAHKKFIKYFKIGKPTINAIKLKGGKLELVQDFPDTADVGVTTVKPPKSCPPPAYERAEQRAEAVLREFLSPQQWADFDKFKKFICKGNDTNDTYILTSRWNRECEQNGILYNRTKRIRHCVSMGDLPPAEELLGLKITIECAEKRFVNGPTGPGYVYDW